MSKYQTRLELNPTPGNPLVALTSKIETLIEKEPIGLAMSALVSAALRLETIQRNGNQREAAQRLARAFADIAQRCEN